MMHRPHLLLNVTEFPEYKNLSVDKCSQESSQIVIEKHRDLFANTTMGCTRTKVGSSSSKRSETLLGSSFTPGKWDVICARGKKVWNHSGNKNLRFLVDQSAARYGQAESKLQRSMIVSDIIDSIRSKTCDTVGFVQQQQNEWVEVSDSLAREKVGNLLRDALSSKYRSSAEAKKRRRKQFFATINPHMERVILSNSNVSNTMDRLRKDLGSDRNSGNSRINQSSSLSSSSCTSFTDDQITRLFNQANSSILSALKSDTSILRRFQDASDVANTESLTLEEFWSTHITVTTTTYRMWRNRDSTPTNFPVEPDCTLRI